MTSLPVRDEPVQVERRVGQRFSYLLPVCLRERSTGLEVLGFTQDVSSRGVFLFVDRQFQAGTEVEITLNMPSEITLGESMRVRCRGRILRVIPADQRSSDQRSSDQRSAAAVENSHHAPSLPQTVAKIGVAVRLEGYEYLPELTETSATFTRVSSLHPHHEHEKDRPLPIPPATGSVLG
jgi:hypothetical protein